MKPNKLFISIIISFSLINPMTLFATSEKCQVGGIPDIGGGIYSNVSGVGRTSASGLARNILGGSYNEASGGKHCIR